MPAGEYSKCGQIVPEIGVVPFNKSLIFDIQYLNFFTDLGKFVSTLTSLKSSFSPDDQVQCSQKVSLRPGTGKIPFSYQCRPNWSQKVLDFYHFGEILDLFRWRRLTFCENCMLDIECEVIALSSLPYAAILTFMCL